MLTYRTSIKVSKKYKSMSHNFTDWSKGPTESFWPLSIWILSALLTIHMPLGLYFQYFGGRRWFTCFVRFSLADYYGDLQFWNHMLCFPNFYFSCWKIYECFPIFIFFNRVFDRFLWFLTYRDSKNGNFINYNWIRYDWMYVCSTLRYSILNRYQC